MKISSENRFEAANQDGYVLISVLLFMVILSVIGVAGNQTSNIEGQIAGNQRQVMDDFYQTEGVLTDAIERENYGKWLNLDDFLSAPPTTAKYSIEAFSMDGLHGSYTLQARCVEETATPIDGLSKNANDTPQDQHEGTPPDKLYGTGFYVRRFAVTVASTDNRTVLQVGVWKAFNRSN